MQGWPQGSCLGKPLYFYTVRVNIWSLSHHCRFYYRTACNSDGEHHEDSIDDDDDDNLGDGHSSDGVAQNMLLVPGEVKDGENPEGRRECDE